MHENGLEKSLTALQEETGVSCRTADSPNTLLADISTGRWDMALRALTPLQLEPRLLIPLYEQIFWEVAEGGEIDAARIILRESEAMGLMREEDEQRYMRLENGLSTAMLSKTAGAKVDLVHKKEAKRAKIAQDLAPHLVSVPNGRLLTLLGEALCYEEAQAMINPARDSTSLHFDIFRGIIPTSTATSSGDALTNVCYKTVTMAHGQHVEAAAFSPDGAYFVVGLADGFIEAWSPVLGQPRTDLVYQTHKSEYMLMETSILALTFSPDSQLLASGSLSGDISIWRIGSGLCIKQLAKAHTGGISSLQFSPDGTTILSAGYDHAVRLFNIRTGSMVREFVGHAEFVQQAVFSWEATRVLSTSSDGTMRIWNGKSGECLQTIRPGPADQLSQRPAKTITGLPKHPDTFILSAQDCPLQVYGANGAAGKTFKSQPTNYSAVCASPSGKYVYAFGEDRQAYCFDYVSGALFKSFPASDTTAGEIIGAVHHPHLNLMATFDTGNAIKFWKCS